MINHCTKDKVKERLMYVCISIYLGIWDLELYLLYLLGFRIYNFGFIWDLGFRILIFRFILDLGIMIFRFIWDSGFYDF
ncbi:hypothetical protein C1646_687274 [Rhizophagus diaphanus]|nr:hypothetical protein C1646_687274 [Rhizophagus diaphanus] [Rhizophagus sp. MUCL 43196]